MEPPTRAEGSSTATFQHSRLRNDWYAKEEVHCFLAEAAGVPPKELLEGAGTVQASAAQAAPPQAPVPEAQQQEEVRPELSLEVGFREAFLSPSEITEDATISRGGGREVHRGHARFSAFSRNQQAF